MFIWPITKAVGDHYPLPGPLTARSARARTEKNPAKICHFKDRNVPWRLDGKAGGEGGTEYRQTLSSSHAWWCGRDERMDPKRQTLRKRHLTNALCLRPTILNSYFFVFCVQSRDFADDCKFWRHWGSKWFLSVGFTSWLVDMQSVNSSVWECHSAVRVCSFVCCAYYDGTPEEAALSETSLKINICSPSCEEFRFRSQDKKSKPTIKTDVKSTETNLIFFRVVVYFFSIPGFVWGSEGLIFRQNWKKH